MGAFSHYELQKAIYQALTGDAALMALVAGIFDRVTEGTAYPYVTIGESAGRDWSTKTTKGVQYLLSLHVWSRGGGRKQAADIMDRIHTVLHDASLAATGHALVLLRFVASEIDLQDDGLTYHGTMRLKALAESTS